MIKAKGAIAAARAAIGTPYAQMDCIGLIKRVIRDAPGGAKDYTTAGTNTLWRSYEASAKYRDLTWRQEGISGAAAGMLAFKCSGEDVHHVGLVTDSGTVIHSSSARGMVVETPLDESEGWTLLAVHRHIEAASAAESEAGMSALYQAKVVTERDDLNVRQVAEVGRIIGKIPRGAVVDVYSVGEWPRIRYGEMLGYASAQYLERIDEAQDPDATQEDAFTTLIREDGVIVMLAGRWRVAAD